MAMPHTRRRQASVAVAEATRPPLAAHGVFGGRLLDDGEHAFAVALRDRLYAELGEGSDTDARRSAADELLVERVVMAAVKARRKDAIDAQRPGGLPDDVRGDLDIDGRLIAAVKALGLDRRFRITRRDTRRSSDDLCAALARLGDDPPRVIDGDTAQPALRFDDASGAPEGTA